MAGVLKLHCIQPPLQAIQARRIHHGMLTTITALSPKIQIIQGIRIAPSLGRARLKQSMSLPWCGRTRREQSHQLNLARLRVFAAKKNVRQKSKAPQQPWSNSAPPAPSTRSAPSLTDLSSQEKQARPVVDLNLKSSRGESIGNNEGGNAEEWNGSVSVSGNAVVWSWSSLPGVIRRQTLRRLSSLPLAIAELLVIAALSALGTIIEQNESPQFYFDSYPEENPLFGFLTWRVIFGASLDHIYSSWYYLGLLLLLASSLIACSTTRQFPIVKVARRWSFLKSSAGFDKLPVSETLEKAKLGDFATLLMAEGFEVFAKGPTLYAFKGLAGRYAPIGVHIALLLIMGGATVSAIGGYHGTVMVPQGLGFHVGDVLAPKGILSLPSPVMNQQVQINKFYIDYLANGTVAQFHSDISIFDRRDNEVFRKTIAVNDPLRYGGLTMYQTDWAIAAVQVRVDGSEPYNLVMASLEKGDNKLFGTFLPLGSEGLEKAKGISILARDLQSVVIYDQEGKFVGVRRPGSGKPILVDGVTIVVDDLIGSSGLELKMDPGVPAVYAGFGALMLTTCISYVSHSQVILRTESKAHVWVVLVTFGQVWALQNGTSLVVGGKSNRAKEEFKLQLNRLLDLVPEVTIFSRPGKLLVNGSSNDGVPAVVTEEETSRVEEVRSN